MRNRTMIDVAAMKKKPFWMSLSLVRLDIIVVHPDLDSCRFAVGVQPESRLMVVCGL